MIALTLLLLMSPGVLMAATINGTVYFADDRGETHEITVNDNPLSLLEIQNIRESLPDIVFTLHTRAKRAGEPLVPEDIQTLRKSNWDPRRLTKFITHGWRGDRNSVACTKPRDAYLDTGDYNVIVMDWNVIANSLMYNVVAKSVPIVGEYVGEFINFLEREGKLDTMRLRLIGHSLGAHIVSLAAMHARSTVAEVAALDPAKPTFEIAGPTGRVDSSHARNVQVIHTNAGLLGLESAVGTSDFYPNGGKAQPGCPFYDIVGVCAHQRSVIYFTESIRNPTGFRGKAVQFLGITLAKTANAYMGGPKFDPAATGSYTLETAGTPPYALN